MNKVVLTFTVIFGFLSVLPADAGTRKDRNHKDRTQAVDASTHEDRALERRARALERRTQKAGRHAKRYAKRHPQLSATGSDPAWLGIGGTAAAPTTGNWSVAVNWDPGLPASSNLTVLDFGGSGGTAYTSTNDISSLFTFGTMNLNSTASVTDIIAGSSFNINGSQIVQINSGAFTIQNSFDNTATNASTTLTLTGNGAGLVTLSGVISEKDSATTMSLVKTGTSTFVLAGANTYSGGTTVLGGTLLVNNTTGSGTGTGAVTVSNSGTVLGGTGTISGAVTVNAGAKIQGGDGTTGTTLTVEGNLTLADNSIIQLALGPGGMHSTLARTGGTWTFDSNQAFTFIDLGAALGTYDNIITGLAIDPGTTASWMITNSGFTGTFTYDGANIDLTLTAIPEPSTWIGGALALGAIGFTQRRRLRNWLRVVG